MQLQNFEQHRSCFCYDNEDSVAKLHQFSLNSTGSLTIHTQEVFFVTRGTLLVQVDRYHEMTLTAGDFIFLVGGSTMLCHALEESDGLSVKIHDGVPECHLFQLGKIAGRIHNIYDGIYPLKVNDRMNRFLVSILETYADGLRCRNYLKGESARMLFLLHAYYPQEECLKFFAQIISPDVKFSEFVRNNWRTCNSVKKMADKICMTPQQFTNRFKKIFGTTPYEWMTQQKALGIYHDICRSNMPLKQISESYDFSSQANFFHFCKHVFGRTPGQIRKSLRFDIESQKSPSGTLLPYQFTDK
jgi:AraC-like DNA-binding protein